MGPDMRLGPGVPGGLQSGGYASHGHAIVANAVTGFRQIYPDVWPHRSEAWTVYTNLGSTGAMRGYGIPQCNFAVECMMDDIAREMGWDPLDSG